MLSWACERARIEKDDLAMRFKNLAEWEGGRVQPTFKQLEKFARTVHVPFGFLLLSEPPEESLPISDFRTISNEARANASPDLIDTLYAMQLCNSDDG